jgi:hypothetical protein
MAHTTLWLLYPADCFKSTDLCKVSHHCQFFIFPVHLGQCLDIWLILISGTTSGRVGDWSVWYNLCHDDSYLSKPAALGEVTLIHQLYRPLSKFIQIYVIIGLMADNTHILRDYNTFSYPPRFPDGVELRFLDTEQDSHPNAM